MNKSFRYIVIIFGTMLLIVLVFEAYSYFQIGKSRLSPGTITQLESQQDTKLTTNKPAPTRLTIEKVAGTLFVPWSLVWTDSHRLLVTERNGAIRVIENDVLKPQPLKTFPEVSKTGEEGLMGLARDPNYVDNHLIYTAVAYTKNKKIVVKIVRFKDENIKTSDDTIIFDDIPAAVYHDGGRIAFGPDGKLYITTGDATKKENAQDLSSVSGKILRINSDGTIPADNPFPNSPIWTYGHRNPEGLAWHPVSHLMYSTEHGPSIIDGPAGGDEINLITKGSNYGWPLVDHEKTLAGTEHPLLLFTPAEAPASAVFYTGDMFPEYKNDLLFGALVGEGIVRVRFDDKDPKKIVEYEKLGFIEKGRIRDIAIGPEGAIYFTTSNRDGRGTPRTGDDSVYRIIKK